MSQVTLDTVILEIDPEVYSAAGGKRRGSVHKLIGGGTVVQDRGFNATDMLIEFSGKTVQLSTVQGLMAVFRKTAYPFTFSDFKGTVALVVFEPQEGLELDVIHGSNSGWTYKIKLRVQSIQTWLGVPNGFPAAQ